MSGWLGRVWDRKESKRSLQHSVSASCRPDGVRSYVSLVRVSVGGLFSGAGFYELMVWEGMGQEGRYRGHFNTLSLLRAVQKESVSFLSVSPSVRFYFQLLWEVWCLEGPGVQWCGIGCGSSGPLGDSACGSIQQSHV